MSKIPYIEKKFGQDRLALIQVANSIIQEYQAAGFDLTLRQLYYQFVARDVIENTLRSYKRLGDLINDGRMAGLIDWEAIVDRTRNVEFQNHWTSPEDILEICAQQYAVDKWVGQPFRVEVWIEKEALAGVLEAVCPDLDVPYFCCRGYGSQSEMWRAARRLLGYARGNQKPYIIHLGDHDPSGIDMTRDIIDRLHTFGCGMEVNRIALNMDQVEEYNPPPNPAKRDDSRFAGYVTLFGDECWELDALEPQVLTALIEKMVLAVRDQDAWDKRVALQNEQKTVLTAVSDNYDTVREHLEERGDLEPSEEDELEPEE